MLSNLAKFTLVLSPLLLSASVLPADAVSRLRPRDGDNLGPWGPGVYMCTEPNWKGDCLWYAKTLINSQGGCTNIPANLAGKISSIGPDHRIQCYFFPEYTCSGDGLNSVQYPGYSDLSTIKFTGAQPPPIVGGSNMPRKMKNWDNEIYSLLCTDLPGYDNEHCEWCYK